jgi:hypothetical protein
MADCVLMRNPIFYPASENKPEQNMATEAEVVKGMNEYMRANGYTCGRNYVDVGDLVKAMVPRTPGETQATLEPKIRKAIATPVYGFKTRGQNDVSASDPPKCGSD